MLQIRKNKFYIFSLIILLKEFFLIYSKQIIFPFKTETINFESSKYIEAITDNRIYITTEVGEPPQKINLILTMDCSCFSIANSSIDSSFYNDKKSNTYLQTSELIQFYSEYFSKAYYANETFIFQTSYSYSDNKKFNNIQFNHIMEFSYINRIYSGYFGLQLPKSYKDINIIDNLKKENIISYSVFNLNYTSDTEGFLSIGELPSEYEDINNQDSIKRANALPCKDYIGVNLNNLCWDLKFNDIKFGDIKVNRDRNARIAPEFGLLIGTNEYMRKIEENYFSKLLKDKCKQSLSENNYYYYECEKNTDISSFKDLIFSHQEFMYDFILTKEDLFKVYEDKLYFLIVFDKYTTTDQYWQLGKPFIKKYNFVYNTDSKQIYFYDCYEKNIKELYHKDSRTIIYFTIIGILALGVIVMAVLVVFKVILKPKKKMADELQENISEYYCPENNNNSLVVN